MRTCSRTPSVAHSNPAWQRSAHEPWPATPLTTPPPTQDAIEVIPDRFYFYVARSATALRDAGAAGLVLHIDSELLYEPFFADFGPLNAGQTFRFCARANELLRVRPLRMLHSHCLLSKACALEALRSRCRVATQRLWPVAGLAPPLPGYKPLQRTASTVQGLRAGSSLSPDTGGECAHAAPRNFRLAPAPSSERSQPPCRKPRRVACP